MTDPSSYSEGQAPSVPGRTTLYVGVAYFVIVTFIVPIGADFYRIPPLGKWAVTGGHLVVLGLMLRREKGKPRWIWIADVPVALFALFQILLMWVWN